MDSKLTKVVTQQEHEYLIGYQHFVTKKTQELRSIIDKLNEKNANNTLKDEKIIELELIINKLRNEAIKAEEQRMG